MLATFMAHKLIEHCEPDVRRMVFNLTVLGLVLTIYGFTINIYGNRYPMKC